MLAPARVFRLTLLLVGVGTEEKKAKGENIWATGAVVCIHCRRSSLALHICDGSKLGRGEEPDGEGLIVSILDSQSSVGSAGKVRRKMRVLFLIVYFVDSRMIPLRPSLSALFVIWCAKRHRCPPLLPLGSKIRGVGRLGGHLFSCFLENWRHLCFGRLWGGMCRFSLQFSA